MSEDKIAVDLKQLLETGQIDESRSSKKALALLKRLVFEIDPLLPESVDKEDELNSRSFEITIQRVFQIGPQKEKLYLKLTFWTKNKERPLRLENPYLHMDLTRKRPRNPINSPWVGYNPDGSLIINKYRLQRNMPPIYSVCDLAVEELRIPPGEDYESGDEDAIRSIMRASPEQELLYTGKLIYTELQDSEQEDRADVFLDLLEECAKCPPTQNLNQHRRAMRRRVLGKLRRIQPLLDERQDHFEYALRAKSSVSTISKLCFFPKKDKVSATERDSTRKFSERCLPWDEAYALLVTDLLEREQEIRSEIERIFTFLKKEASAT